CFNKLTQLYTNRSIIYNPGTRNMDAFYAVNVRLNFSNFLRIYLFNSFNSIDLAGFENVIQPGNIFFLRSHDHFPTNFMSYTIFTADINQLAAAFYTVFISVAIGFVVNTCVNNSLIITGLMSSHLLLLFES